MVNYTLQGVHGCSSGIIFKISEAPRRAPGLLGAIGQQSELLIENLTSYGSASFPRVGAPA